MDRFTENGHVIVDRRIVRDEIEEIRAVVAQSLAAELDALLMTVGPG